MSLTNQFISNRGMEEPHKVSTSLPSNLNFENYLINIHMENRPQTAFCCPLMQWWMLPSGNMLPLIFIHTHTHTRGYARNMQSSLYSTVSSPYRVPGMRLHQHWDYINWDKAAGPTRPVCWVRQVPLSGCDSLWAGAQAEDNFHCTSEEAALEQRSERAWGVPRRGLIEGKEVQMPVPEVLKDLILGKSMLYLDIKPTCGGFWV